MVGRAGILPAGNARADEPAHAHPHVHFLWVNTTGADVLRVWISVDITPLRHILNVAYPALNIHTKGENSWLPLNVTKSPPSQPN